MNNFAGLFAIGGGHNVGKTYAALTAPYPFDKTVFFDGDVKGMATILQIGGVSQFSQYHDLVKLRQERPKELDFYKAVVDLFDAIPDDTEVVIIDPWASFSQVINWHVHKHRDQFRDDWRGGSAIAGGKIWQETFAQEMRILRNILAKTRLLILTGHLKSHYVGGHKSGKVVPDFSKAVNRVAIFRCWLRHNPNQSSVPIALTQKSLGRIDLVDGKKIPINITPPKLTPIEGETSLWDMLERYWANPVNNRELTDDERLTQAEINDLSGTLTDEERQTFHLMLKIEADAIEEETEIERQATADEDISTTISRMKFQGMTVSEIADKLNISVPEVLKHSQ